MALKGMTPFEQQNHIDKLHVAAERLVGLSMAPQPGVRVVLSKQVCECVRMRTRLFVLRVRFVCLPAGSIRL